MHIVGVRPFIRREPILVAVLALLGALFSG
jgi:hypothetical protein